MIDLGQIYTTYFGDKRVASFTKNTRQKKCTENCSNTVVMVYRLKIFGNGRCCDSVFRGLDREMNRKQAARRTPCKVACASLNLIPSKYSTDWL